MRTTITLASGFAVFLGLANAEPLATGTDTLQYGNVLSGEKFGAHIGQASFEAERIMVAQGYGYEGVVACNAQTAPLLGCQQNQLYLAFQPVQNGHRGHIYLRIENDRVAQIGWALHAVATLDG